VALFGDPAVAAWIWPPERDESGPRTADQANALIDRFLGHWADHGYGMWYWTERESGEFVGQVGFQHAEVQGERHVEIGWTLMPTQQGKGYATEAATAVLAHGFDALDLDEVVSFTLPHNSASRRVMEKIGLTYDRDFSHVGLPHVLYRCDAPADAPARRSHSSRARR
jgi:ribosomal-protein-alanine N-acetyltransferase